MTDAERLAFLERWSEQANRVLTMNRIAISHLLAELEKSERLANAWRDRCKSAEHLCEAIAAGVSDDLLAAGVKPALPDEIAAIFGGAESA